MKNVVIGLDIGGTNSKVGIVDDTGQVLAYHSFPSHGQESFNLFIEALTRCVADLKQQVAGNIIGIGVGAPNTNANTGRMEFAHNFRWGDFVPLVDRIESVFNLPVFATNDANAAAMGEQFFGAAKGMSNFIVVTLGTGLGSGIILNNTLLNGCNGFGGEMGHVSVRRGGRQCKCGKSGCLETYASATGIKRTVAKLLADSSKSSELRSIAYNNLDGRLITQYALQGDLLAQEAFSYTGDILGRKLADVAILFDPEAIILAGGLTKADELLLHPTRLSFEKHSFPPQKGKVRILLSQMEDSNAAVQGAAALAWKGVNGMQQAKIKQLKRS